MGHRQTIPWRDDTWQAIAQVARERNTTPTHLVREATTFYLAWLAATTAVIPRLDALDRRADATDRRLDKLERRRGATA